MVVQTTTSTSKLLDLPPELRCIIYHFYFTDLVEAHEDDAARFLLPTEWPNNDFTGYISLILTCKLINGEAVPVFKKHFTSRVKLHFETVKDAYDFCQRPSSGELETSTMKFSIRHFVDMDLRETDASIEDDRDDSRAFDELHAVHNRKAPWDCQTLFPDQHNFVPTKDWQFCAHCSFRMRSQLQGQVSVYITERNFAASFRFSSKELRSDTIWWCIAEITGRLSGLD